MELLGSIFHTKSYFTLELPVHERTYKGTPTHAWRTHDLIYELAHELIHEITHKHIHLLTLKLIHELIRQFTIISPWTSQQMKWPKNSLMNSANHRLNHEYKALLDYSKLLTKKSLIKLFSRADK